MSAQNADTARFDPTDSVGWHGWGTDHWSLHIGPLPGRKSVCLYYMSGAVLDTLAFFRDYESAFRALAMIDKVVALAQRHIDGSGADA